MFIVYYFLFFHIIITIINYNSYIIIIERFFAMNKIVETIKKHSIILAIAVTVIGLIFIFIPSMSLKIISLCISITGLVVSAITIFNYIKNKEYQYSGKFLLYIWVFVFILSLYLTIRPTALISFIYSILGFIILANGISKLMTAIEMRNNLMSKWWIYLMISAAVIILGVICLASPFEAARTLLMFIGISLVISGVSDIISYFIMNKTYKIK